MRQSSSIRRLAACGAALAVVAACRDDRSLLTGPGDPTAPEAASAPAPPVFRFISAGSSHTCGVTTGNQLYCWGSNFLGQLGDGTRTGHPVPALVKSTLSWRNVTAGEDYTCAETTDDRAYCWGYGFYGRLGDGTQSQIVTLPTAVLGEHRFRLVRAGKYHTCGITRLNVAYCWGRNDNYQLGDGTKVKNARPTRLLGNLQWRWISPGGYHTCGVTTDSKAWCVGRNSESQLGTGTGGRTLAQVAGGRAWSHLESGLMHTCGVTESSVAFCWGQEWGGNIGDGVDLEMPRSFPVRVAGGLGFSQIVAGQFETCGITTDQRGYCWGANTQGELGDGTTTRRLVPTPVGGSLTLARITLGDSHACGITPTGKGYCWGEGRAGQLGDGALASRLLPSPVTAPAN